MVLLSSCGTTYRTYEIPDVAQSQTIILEKEPAQENIYSWSVIAKGNLVGEAEISVILDGEPYQTEFLSGEVDFQWSGDWYSDQAEILYTPTSVTDGTLSLEYRFYD